MSATDVTLQGARAGMSVFENLPEYIEPTVQGPERQTVSNLTGIPDTALTYVDENVLSSLPKGTEVLQLRRAGTAYWTKTAVVKTKNAEGHRSDYFLKITHTDVGKGNLRGEYESMSAVYKEMPDFVPAPLATGTYAADPDIHFYLMQFVEMTDTLPNPEDLSPRVAEMHKRCLSPNGRYGFVVPTNMGAMAQPNKWTESWEEFFTNLLQRCFDWEQGMHGKHDEMQKLWPVLKDKVIPRLLRPLETGGNEIQPCLVHGDLWDGNTSVNAITDQPLIFDGSSCYAHNEYELGAWVLERHRIQREYTSAYYKDTDIAQPEEDFEDRLKLYAFRFDLVSSGCYLNNLKFRELCLEDMRYLAAKYPQGYQGAEKRKGSK